MSTTSSSTHSVHIDIGRTSTTTGNVRRWRVLTVLQCIDILTVRIRICGMWWTVTITATVMMDS